MAVGLLLLQSFWSNEAIFQLMMLAYNLFLLCKMDFTGKTEYRQQITCACGTGAGKTFRLKHIFLAGKITLPARSVVMKLSEKNPYRGRNEKSVSQKYQSSCLNPLLRFIPTRQNHFRGPNLEKWITTFIASWWN
jgi:hypothetical protein